MLNFLKSETLYGQIRKGEMAWNQKWRKIMGQTVLPGETVVSCDDRGDCIGSFGNTYVPFFSRFSEGVVCSLYLNRNIRGTKYEGLFLVFPYCTLIISMIVYCRFAWSSPL